LVKQARVLHALCLGPPRQGCDKAKLYGHVLYNVVRLIEALVIKLGVPFSQGVRFLTQEAELMKTRHVTLAGGEAFSVPQGIQRLDSKTTRGWQVRYQGTKYFPDGEAGPAKALEAATRELLRRIATLPAPVVLKRGPSAHKRSGLPAGISGPIVLTKANSAEQSAVLSVLIPRFGQVNQIKHIYIGTPNTYTKTRYRAALAQALEMRAESLARYTQDATRAKRKEAAAFRKSLHG
jgi:hypothetical protein